MAAEAPHVMHVITDLDVVGAERMLTSYLTAPRPGAGQVTVVSLISNGYFAKALRNSGIEVQELGMGSGLANLKALFRLAGLIRRYHPDVLQSWMYHADLLATFGLMLSGRRRKTRLIWGVRCSDMDTSRYGVVLRMVIRLSALLSGLPDAVVANSHAGRRVHQALGYRTRRFDVIPNGVDTSQFKPDEIARREIREELGINETAKVAVLVARRDPMKDHETFIAALDTSPEIVGIVAGLGTETLPDRPNLRRLGRRDDIERVYAASDVVVLSSAFGEGFPNVLVEGMATGLVPVATDVGDSALIVDNVGEVVPPKDSDALAAALRRIAALDFDGFRSRGTAARARTEADFSLSRAVTAFDTLYHEMLSAAD